MKNFYLLALCVVTNTKVLGQRFAAGTQIQSIKLFNPVNPVPLFHRFKSHFNQELNTYMCGLGEQWHV